MVFEDRELRSWPWNALCPLKPRLKVLPFASLSGVLRRPPGKKGMEAGFRAALLAMTDGGTGRQPGESESILFINVSKPQG